MEGTDDCTLTFSEYSRMCEKVDILKEKKMDLQYYQELIFYLCFYSY